MFIKYPNQWVQKIKKILFYKMISNIIINKILALQTNKKLTIPKLNN